MTAPRSALVAAKPKGRSRTSNGNQLLAGIDGRSTEARRLRDLICLYAAEFNIQSDAQLARVETAAGLKLGLETMTARMVRGESVDEAELARLSSELRAVLSDLKRRSQRSDCCGGAPGPYAAVLISDDDEVEAD